MALEVDTSKSRGGAPLGNQNAVKAKRWQQAIMRALARFSKEDVDKGLDVAADKLVLLAVDGDKWALEELGDRIDGKPQQTVEATFDAGSGLLAVLTGFSKSDDSPMA